MPTQLTAPVVEQAITATLDAWELHITRTAALGVDQPESSFTAGFVFRRADGSVLQRRSLTRQVDQLPVNVRNAIAALHAALITASRAAGILPAGVDTADF
jgi:hypothetical protein